MCGIVGYIGPRDATPIILNGLRRLEYRGYDSAGLAVLENSHIEVRREAGKLDRRQPWWRSRCKASRHRSTASPTRTQRRNAPRTWEIRYCRHRP
jgi:glucosamine 6-phosphate synthetase-like amidotransferase/phosphosugar isomerase protein